MPTLSLITFLPLAGSIILLFMPKENVKAIQTVALSMMALAFALSVVTLLQFDPGTLQMDALPMQFEEKFVWIGGGQDMFTIHYHLGVDGLSFPRSSGRRRSDAARLVSIGPGQSDDTDTPVSASS